MKRFSTLLLLVACAVMAQAQKLDTQLMLLVGQSGTRGEQVVTNQKVLQDKLCANLNADGSIQSVPVIGYLQRGAECPVGVLKTKGIEVKRVVDNMVSMVVPVGQLTAFEAIDEFILIIPMTKADIYNKEAAALSKASVVNTATSATAAGLPRNYTGKGVVVGIIDRGIDYNHQAFYDAQGKTRVVKIINGPENNKEVTEESEIVKLTTDHLEQSHGTHTSATAVGSELGNGLHGVATEADIKETSVKDEFCTDISKIPGRNLVQAGVGKIDAAAGMKKVLELTGIRTVDADQRQDADAAVYNLMGQKVERNHKGIVISNGRKYVRK